MVTSEWGTIYKELGAQPVINATGSVTLLGGSTSRAGSQGGDGARRQCIYPVDRARTIGRG